MAPEVLTRKLAVLLNLLRNLAPYKEVALAEVEAEHYKIERLLELLVMAASGILFHVLAERGREAGTYRGTFRLAAQEGLLPEDLANRLQQAAAMRNVLVHMYDEIDYEILRDSIAPALDDFGMFVSIFSKSTWRPNLVLALRNLIRQ